jgi:hypothetical protein
VSIGRPTILLALRAIGRDVVQIVEITTTNSLPELVEEFIRRLELSYGLHVAVDIVRSK